MSLSLPTPGVEALLLALVLGAAVYDVRYRRIPNWITVLGALLGVLLNTFPGLLYQHFLKVDWSGLWFSLAGLGFAFGIYVVLYALRAMGAGDVKLMAAAGAIVGWQNWFGIFVITAIVGGVMSLILITLSGRVKKTLFNVAFILSEMKNCRPAYLGNEELDVRNKKALGLPHGAVIALGTIFFLATAVHFAQ
ncbi:MAG TPA: A24 family peptidase [Candidatus Solibacter sp.]|nr:A24 family peptidase [Candidatus Solibacter sp.]